MKQVTRPATSNDASVMRPMLCAYQEYIGQFSGSVDPHRELENAWFEKPGLLFPFLIVEDERPVGILLLMGRAYAEACGAEVDYYINDLFVIPDARGSGTAAKAVTEVLQRFQGTWGLEVLQENRAALGFWKKNLPGIATDLEIGGPRDQLWYFRFST
ncbi:MAG: GNAT family N-acetyltransferase [bacterium]|nr:GNAT family N-acetyltransferase [bacterium]